MVIKTKILPANSSHGSLGSLGAPNGGHGAPNGGHGAPNGGHGAPNGGQGGGLGGTSGAPAATEKYSYSGVINSVNASYLGVNRSGQGSHTAATTGNPSPPLPLLFFQTPDIHPLSTNLNQSLHQGLPLAMCSNSCNSDILCLLPTTQ